MKKVIFFVLLLLASASLSQAQFKKTTSWTFEASQSEVKTGEVIELIFKVKVIDEWYIYASDIDEDLGPMPTAAAFEDNDSFELIGGLTSVNPKEKYDSIWEGDVRYFEPSGVFKQKVKVLAKDLKLSGTLSFQTCTDVNGQCIPGEADFNFAFIDVIGGENLEASKGYDGLLKVNQGDSLVGFFFAAFLFGLAALLTPCVFPMIPMTVAFFTNSSQSRVQAKVKALSYGFSIILIYILIGMIFTSFFGVGIANDLATGAVANIIFFTVFVVFAISFFGYFEINLPTGFVNKMDRKADKGGFLGVFFMAFTLVLVSFSCTGPIVGSVLIQSFQGEVIKPVIGMLGFSSAFAIPFTIFAFFPGLLKDLPKSGGWLNSVKVVLGFIELALGFKFLSIADQAYHWGLLDREVYLAIWIVIGLALALYLFGVIRFPHDSKKRTFSLPKFSLGLLSFGFAVYLFLGFLGNPLNALAGYLPPEKNNDFSFAVALGIEEKLEVRQLGPEGFEGEVKYADFLELPHGLRGFFDYDQALKYAKEVDKPIFIDFTGHGCVNCRKMEQYVWSDEKVLNLLATEYVVLALYVDDKTELPESEWYTSSFDERVKKTIGKQNFDLQITKFNGNAQPYYVLLDTGEQPLTTPKGYESSIEAFVSYLKEGLSEFEQRKSAIVEGN